MEKYINKLKSVITEQGLTRLHEGEEPQQKPQAKVTQPIADKTVISNQLASEYFARARALATTTHFAHLSTDSFSEHTALATFYEDIISIVDKFCESYIGLYGKFISMPPISAEMALAEPAIIEFRDWVSSNRQLITDDSSLQNIIDEMLELCNTTVYKLQKLK